MRRIDPGIYALLISLIVIGGGFLIGYLTSNMSIGNLITSFLIVSFFVLISVGVGVYVFIPIVERVLISVGRSVLRKVENATENVNLKIGAFEGRMDIFQVFQDPDWVLTTNDLVKKEAETPMSEVWIISSYLGAEMVEDLFAPVIRENVRRGVKYYYVVPNDHLSLDKVRSIARMAGEGVKAIEVRDSDFFNLVSSHDTCVFDPFERSPNAATGYMNVPNDVNQIDYFIKLSPDYARRLVSTIKAKGVPVTVSEVI